MHTPMRTPTPTPMHTPMRSWPPTPCLKDTSQGSRPGGTGKRPSHRESSLSIARVCHQPAAPLLSTTYYCHHILFGLLKTCSCHSCSLFAHPSYDLLKTCSCHSRSRLTHHMIHRMGWRSWNSFGACIKAGLPGDGSNCSLPKHQPGRASVSGAWAVTGAVTRATTRAVNS